MLCNGASVEVRDKVCPLARKHGIIVEAHPDLLHYDLAYEDGTRENLLPAYRYCYTAACVCVDICICVYAQPQSCYKQCTHKQTLHCYTLELSHCA
jgi:hypothetical protein